MESQDVEAAWEELARARRVGSPEARSFGELAVQSTLHVGDAGTFFCHVMQAVAPGRWELWRLASPLASGVFAARVGSAPSHWMGAGSITIEAAIGAFIPDVAADEIQALEDDEGATDFADEAIGGLAAGALGEVLVKTPGGASLAAFRLAGPGRHDVLKGLDARGQVCALAILG